MTSPLLALLGVGVGILGTGTVILGGSVASLSLGSIAAPTASAPITSFGPPGTPALSAATQAAAVAAASTCPGLDWTLLGAAVLVDPALSAGLTSAANDLCPSTNRAATLTALVQGPVEGQIALVLSHALDANADLDTAVAAAISFAAANLGVPYRWGGTGSGGFDCSGLTLKAYQAAGVAIPHVAQAQYDTGPRLPAGGTAAPGDLVFFGSGPKDVSHVGLYLGGAVMIDAPHTGADVRIEATPTTPGARFGSDVFIGATRPA